MEDLLVDVLECSVCLNQLDSTARVLPCQHTFCYGCLTDITNSHKELRCPECRVLVTVSIDQLPCNILLMRILEGIKNSSQTTTGTTSDVVTSTPVTTDFSYILNLYNTTTACNTTTAGNTVTKATGNSLVNETSLPNNTGFSNQVLNTIAYISNASPRVLALDSFIPTSVAPAPNITNCGSITTQSNIQTLGGTNTPSIFGTISTSCSLTPLNTGQLSISSIFGSPSPSCSQTPLNTGQLSSNSIFGSPSPSCSQTPLNTGQLSSNSIFGTPSTSCSQTPLNTGQLSSNSIFGTPSTSCSQTPLNTGQLSINSIFTTSSTSSFLISSNAVMSQSSGNLNNICATNPFLDQSQRIVLESSSLTSSPVPFQQSSSVLPLLQQSSTVQPLLQQFSSIALTPQRHQTQSSPLCLLPQALQPQPPLTKDTSLQFQQLYTQNTSNAETIAAVNVNSSIVWPSVLPSSHSETIGQSLSSLPQQTLTCKETFSHSSPNGSQIRGLIPCSTSSLPTLSESSVTASESSVTDAFSIPSLSSLRNPCSPDIRAATQCFVFNSPALQGNSHNIPNLPTHTSITNAANSALSSIVSMSPDVTAKSTALCESSLAHKLPAALPHHVAGTHHSALTHTAAAGAGHTASVTTRTPNRAPAGHSTSVLLSADAHLNGAAAKQFDVPVCARALYNYNGTEPRDLSFQKGSMIRLVKTVDCNWYIGECGGSRGYVPCSYVECVAPGHCQGVALYNFKMASDGDTQGPAAHCLSFSKGDVLSVLRRVDRNWGEGSLGGAAGIFPLAFVQLNPAAAALLQLPSLADRSRRFSTANTNTAATDCSASSPCTVSSASSVTSIVSSTVGTNSNSTTSNRTNTSTTITTTSATTNGTPATSDLPPLTIPANTGLPAASKGASADNMAMLYVSRFSYRPQKADEVALTAGGLYAVTQRCHDGWFKGRCLTTHQTGVFPGNYLHPARGQTIADYLNRRSSVGHAPSSSPVVGTRSASSGRSPAPPRLPPPPCTGRKRGPRSGVLSPSGPPL